MAEVLVLGASGLLGHDLCRVLVDAGFSVVAAARNLPTFAFGSATSARLVSVQLDALNTSGLAQLLASRRISQVINCVALTRPDRTQARAAYAVNARLPAQISAACQTVGARFIHISTDAVFGPQQGPCHPYDVPTPDRRSLYSRSKALGEQIPMGIVVRTSFVGQGQGRHRSGLLDRVADSSSRSVDTFPGCLWNGLTTLSLSRCLCSLISEPPPMSGVIHIASSVVSKTDLVSAINAVYGLRKVVRPVTPAFSTRVLVPTSGFFIADAIRVQLEEYRDWREKGACGLP